MRAANILEPVLARICDDSENPRIEPAAHFSKMLVRLDEAGLQNILGDIGTACHSECVAVKRIAVTLDQDSKCVLGSCKNAGDDFLIGIGLINRIRGGCCCVGLLRG